MGDIFQEMGKTGLLERKCAGRMVRAVGFRNTVIYACQQIDFKIVCSIITQNPEDFKGYS
jgi:uncharacterized protein YutE (UPF0331/DUF86 family)